MPGMDEDENKGARYMPVDDISDSDEADMDLSDSDNPDADQPNKKQARTDSKAADGDSVPKWSNPDPYTALPPPDAEKKKDMVKLIRKARVAQALEGTSKTEAVSDDFISFDFGNETEEEPYEPPPPRASKDRQANSSAALRPSQPEKTPPQGSLNQVMPKDLMTARSGNQPSQGVTFNLPAKPQTGVSNGNGTGRVAAPIDLTEDSPPNSRKPGVGRAPAAVVESLTSDPALGSRKRNARDEIKPAPRIHDSTRGKKKPSDGEVGYRWRPVSGQNPTPWVGIDHSDTTSMGFW